MWRPQGDPSRPAACQSAGQFLRLSNWTRFKKEGVRCAHRLPNHKEKDKEKAMTSATRTSKVQKVDMKLEVAFEKLDDKITRPLFRPAKG